MLDFSSIWLSYGAPTAAPSFHPSAPSFPPTLFPSQSPTLTYIPTAEPTKQTTPDVSFETYIFSQGLTSNNMSADAITIFTETVAKVMGIDISRIHFLNYLFVQTSLRRLDERTNAVVTPTDKHDLISVESIHLQAVYSLYMNYSIIVSMIDYPSFSPTDTFAVFSNLTNVLRNSVSSGTFIAALIETSSVSNVDIFNTATPVLVNTYGYQVIAPPTEMPTYAPISRNPISPVAKTIGEIAAVVLAVLLGSVILMYWLFLFLTRLRDRKEDYADNNNDQSLQEDNLEEALTSVVPVQQGVKEDKDQIVIVNNENYELAF